MASRRQNAARRLAANATFREQGARRGARCLDRRRPGSCARHLGGILGAQPLDVLAFRLAHFKQFLARTARRDARFGRARVATMEPGPRGLRYRAVLRSFAHEECGDYAIADPPAAPRSRSIRAMSGAHMRLRTSWKCRVVTTRGIAWLEELERHWDGANNLLHHLWWHRALFHLERREFDAVVRSLRPALP